MPAETVVVQAFRPAVSGRPEGLHYFRRQALQACQTRRTLRPALHFATRSVKLSWLQRQSMPEAGRFVAAAARIFHAM